MKASLRLSLAAVLVALGWAPPRRITRAARSRSSFPIRPGAPPTSWRACWRRNSPISWDRISSSRTSAAAEPPSPPAGSARDAGWTHAALHNLQISANVALYPRSDSTPKRTSRRSPSSTRIRWCWSAESRSAPSTLPSSRLDEDNADEDGASRDRQHRAPGHVAARQGGARVDVVHVPYRGAAPALQDIAGGHVDLFFATPQSVVQQVTTGQMKAYGITAKGGLRCFRTSRASCRSSGPSSKFLLACAVRARRDAEAGHRQAQCGASAGDGRSAIVKAWADTGVAPFGKDQRSPQAAQALLQNEISRWSQVVRENNIQPSD